MISYNRVVEKTSDKFNLSLPVAIKREFDGISARFGSKSKWTAFAAAMIMFVEAGEGRQNAYVQEVVNAGGPLGSFDDLLKRAKKGKVLSTSGVDAPSRLALNQPPRKIAAMKKPRDDGIKKPEE